jgi:hypothetical protein
MKTLKMINSISTLIVLISALLIISCDEITNSSQKNGNTDIVIEGPKEVYDMGDEIILTARANSANITLGRVTWVFSDSDTYNADAESEYLWEPYELNDYSVELMTRNRNLEERVTVYVFAVSDSLVSPAYSVIIRPRSEAPFLLDITVSGTNIVHAGNGEPGSNRAVQMLAVPFPLSAILGTVEWSISETVEFVEGQSEIAGVAKIDPSGRLTASVDDIEEDIEIYIFAKSGEVLSLGYLVTVKPYTEPPDDMLLDIIISGNSGRVFNLMAGDGFTLGVSMRFTARAVPNDAALTNVIWSVGDSPVYTASTIVHGFANINPDTSLLSATDFPITQNKTVYVFARSGDTVSSIPFEVLIYPFVTKPPQWDLGQNKWEWKAEDQAETHIMDETLSRSRIINSVRWFVRGDGHNNITISNKSISMINNPRMFIGAGRMEPPTAARSNTSEPWFDPEADFILPQSGYVYFTMEYQRFFHDQPNRDEPISVFLNNNTNGNGNTVHRQGAGANVINLGFFEDHPERSNYQGGPEVKARLFWEINLDDLTALNDESREALGSSFFQISTGSGNKIEITSITIEYDQNERYKPLTGIEISGPYSVMAGQGDIPGGTITNLIPNPLPPNHNDTIVWSWSISDTNVFTGNTNALAASINPITGVLTAALDDGWTTNKTVYVFATATVTGMNAKVVNSKGYQVTVRMFDPALVAGQKDLRVPGAKWEWTAVNDPDITSHVLTQGNSKTISGVTWFAFINGIGSMADGISIPSAGSSLLVGSKRNVATSNNAVTGYDPEGEFILGDSGIIRVTIDVTRNNGTNPNPLVLGLNHNQSTGSATTVHGVNGYRVFPIGDMPLLGRVLLTHDFNLNTIAGKQALNSSFFQLRTGAQLTAVVVHGLTIEKLVTQ